MKKVLSILVTGAALTSCGSIVKHSSSSKAGAEETYVSSDITVSKELLSSVFAGNKDSEQSIDEMTNGMHVVGKSSTDGEVYVELTKGEKRASFSVLYKSTTKGDTVGRKNVGGGRHVRVNSSFQTGLHTRKQIFFEETGYSSLGTLANGDTALRINDVALFNARGGYAILGQNMARNQVMSQRGNAEASINSAAKNKAIKESDTESDKELNVAQKNYNDSFYNPIVKAGYFPGQMQTTSNTDRLSIVVDQPRNDRTGEISAKPTLDETQGMKVTLHETLINGMYTRMLSGQKMKLAEFKTKMASVLGTEPVITPDDEKYSISFPDDQNPLNITFKDGQLTMAIHSTGYYVGESREPAMDVFVTYNLTVSDDGKLKGLRTEEGVVVVPPGYKPGDPMSSRQRDMQAKLKKAYSTELKEEFVVDKLPFTSGFGNHGGKLIVKELVSTNGWLGMILDN